MERVVKALVAVFTVIGLGLLAIFWLAKYRLEHARYTEHFAVMIAAPAYSVSSAEQQIAEPIEEALAQVKGLESLRTVVQAGLVVITAEVTAVGVDAPHPLMLAQEALAGAQRSLPQDLSPPSVQRLDAQPTMLRIIARSETMSRMELSRWLDEVFRRKVEVQNGVREVRLCGDVHRELKITLDQQRLRAYGLAADEVLNALRIASFRLPSGRVEESRFAVRIADGRLEDLQQLELRGPEVRLRDVATLEDGAEEGPCTSARDVLVTVNVFPETKLELPSQPGVTLTPFTAKRSATFLSPPGMSVRAAMHALTRQYPDAMITAERDALTVMFSEEPARVDDVPGLALRSMDGLHSIVQVSGPDFDQLVSLGKNARELLAKEQTRWLGVTWPGLAPEQVLEPVRGVKGLAELLQLAIGGVSVGRMEDGSNIRVRTDATKIEDLVLADGRHATEVMKVSMVEGPAAMLRVNRQRTVELEVGLDAAEVRRAVSALQLPSGYSVSVSER